MLGPAELREIYDCLKGMGLEPVRVKDSRSPYLTQTFAAGMAVTKAVRAVASVGLPAALMPSVSEGPDKK